MCAAFSSLEIFIRIGCLIVFLVRFLSLFHALFLALFLVLSLFLFRVPFLVLFQTDLQRHIINQVIKLILYHPLKFTLCTEPTRVTLSPLASHGKVTFLSQKIKSCGNKRVVCTIYRKYDKLDGYI